MEQKQLEHLLALMENQSKLLLQQNEVHHQQVNKILENLLYLIDQNNILIATLGDTLAEQAVEEPYANRTF